MNALGNFIPPMTIYPRVRMRDALLYGAPPQTIAVRHKSGWMQSEIFVQWFKHFLHPTKDDPGLFVLDGHASHTKNFELIDMARENYVEILCLPPHCTHKLQPIDVLIMGLLSAYYSSECKKY